MKLKTRDRVKLCLNFLLGENMKYKIADIIVEFEPKYNILKDRAQKYIDKTSKYKGQDINVSDENIQKVKIENPLLDLKFSEYMLIGTKFYKTLLNYNGCLLHASAVVIDEEASLFSADCGPGTSTHTSLWLKYLADKKPYILNDDKPAIRSMEDGIYVYGTPFSGKHDINQNKKVKLKAICFLEQSKTNSIRKVETKEAIKLFFEQTMIKLKEEDMIKLLDILDAILKEIPVYKLCCDISEEAVQLSYKTMKGENTNEN